MLDMFQAYETELQILGSIVLALVLGGVIGSERELAHKPAGLRTHMLVAAAAALLVGLSGVLLTHYDHETAESAVKADPIRVLEAIITGIAFLGAGTIIRGHRKQEVEGLTTAASLLLTAGIGAAVALHLFVVAVGSTILALVTLRLFRFVEERAKKKIAKDPPSPAR